MKRIGIGLALIGVLFFIPRSAVAPLSAATAVIPASADTSCDILTEAHKSYDLLASTSLSVSSEPLIYTENRISGHKEFIDSVKEIALAALDTSNCKTQIVTIVQQGNALRAPDGWQIEALQRFNGIQWNFWNTEYSITKPKNMIVIGNKYPDVNFVPAYKTLRGTIRKDKIKHKQTVDYRIYLPYSSDLHKPDIVTIGNDYLHQLTQQAFADLASRSVPSKAIPGKLITEVPVIASASFEHLPLVEQADLSEFFINPKKTAERVLVLLALNREKTSQYTCNYAGACGLMQFTKPTYLAMVKKYPAAGLNPDFISGAQDPVNSIKAAMLLYDNNLQDLIHRYGQKILSDANIYEYLAAYYNVSPGLVNAAILKLKAQKNPTYDWATKLPSETKGYIAKLRYLRDVLFASIANPS